MSSITSSVLFAFLLVVAASCTTSALRLRTPHVVNHLAPKYNVSLGSHTTSGPLNGAQPMSALTSSLYIFLDASHNLVALNRSTGAKAWVAPAVSQWHLVTTTSSAFRSDVIIFNDADSGNAAALDAASGTRLWHYNYSMGSNSGTPRYYNAKLDSNATTKQETVVLFLVNDNDQMFIASLFLRNGTIRWTSNAIIEPIPCASKHSTEDLLLVMSDLPLTDGVQYSYGIEGVSGTIAWSQGAVWGTSAWCTGGVAAVANVAGLQQRSLDVERLRGTMRALRRASPKSRNVKSKLVDLSSGDTLLTTLDPTTGTPLLNISYPLEVKLGVNTPFISATNGYLCFRSLGPSWLPYSTFLGCVSVLEPNTPSPNGGMLWWRNMTLADLQHCEFIQASSSSSTPPQLLSVDRNYATSGWINISVWNMHNGTLLRRCQTKTAYTPDTYYGEPIFKNLAPTTTSPTSKSRDTFRQLATNFQDGLVVWDLLENTSSSSDDDSQSTMCSNAAMLSGLGTHTRVNAAAVDGKEVFVVTEDRAYKFQR